MSSPTNDPGLTGQGPTHLTTVTAEAVVHPTSRRALFSHFVVLDASGLTHQLPSVIVTRSGGLQPAFGVKWASETSPGEPDGWRQALR